MDKPLVSIITPSYNQSKYIEDCILSVQNQEYKNIEHIIVDNCSTDETIDILNKYMSRFNNLRYVSEKDSSMYEAINKGFAMANGEIFAYLNCDDLYFPWTVKIAVENILQKKKDLVFGHLVNVNLVSNSLILHFKRKYNFFYYTMVDFINQPTVFFTRKLFLDLGGFNENYKLVADCEFWIRAYLKGYVPYLVDEFLAIERDHELMQRSTKRGLLLKEISDYRLNYFPGNKIKYFHLYLYHRLINKLFSVKSIALFLFSNKYRIKSLRSYRLDFIRLILGLIKISKKNIVGFDFKEVYKWE